MTGNTLEDIETSQQRVIELVLRSETFQNSPVCSALLQYLYEHRSQEIGEYEIGTGVLARRESFDPRSDSHVRVQISRLRAKLAEFSAKEGKGEPLQVVVPRGTYRVEFVGQSAMVDARQPALLYEPTAPSGAVVRNYLPSPPVGNRTPILSLFLATAVLACALAMSVRHNLKSVGTNAPGGNVLRPPLTAGAKDSFWANLLGSGRSIHIVVPKPVFYAWRDDKAHDSIMVRSIRSNEFGDLNKSPMLAELEKQHGPSTLSQEYVSAYDMISAFTLASFLKDSGFSADLSTSDALSFGEVNRETLVLMGTVQTLQPYQRYFKRLTFSFTSTPQTIESRDPLTGKNIEFNAVVQSKDSIVIPQLLACLPGDTPDSRILLIEGYKDIATIAYITSREGQEELRRLQRANHDNPFFEAVVTSEIDRDIPVSSRIAAYKAIAYKK